jgi:hypothetical protein
VPTKRAAVGETSTTSPKLRRSVLKRPVMKRPRVNAAERRALDETV